MSGPTRTVRALVIRRDDGRCVRCGKYVADPDSLAPWVQYSLQHRRARGAGGSKDPVTNSPVNLIVLCGDGVSMCHGEVESERETARQCGYAIAQWQDPHTVPVKHHRHGWAWLTTDGWVPLTQAELWLAAGQWLADAQRDRVTTDPDGVVSLATAAAELFGIRAGEAA